jgi:cytochrome c2
VFAAVAALTACSGQKPQSQEDASTVDAGAVASNEAATGSGVSASATPEATPEATIAANTAPPAFAQCQSCHSSEPGKNGVGPSLAGVFGTKAAEVAGYNFSPAMKASGLTWDEATLNRYLQSPRTVVPGTKMTFPGIKDDAKRATVIAYLKSIG